MIRRLLADSDLNRAIVTGTLRRNLDLDFKTRDDLPLDGMPDDIVLDIAAKDFRVLVSHDVGTMWEHFREHVKRRSSPGLVLIPQSLSIALAIECLLLVCAACDARDLQNRICLAPSLVMYSP